MPAQQASNGDEISMKTNATVPPLTVSISPTDSA
jgi:hypothetical protein